MRYPYVYADTGEEVEVVRPAQAMPDDLVINGRPARRVWNALTVPGISIDKGGGTQYKQDGLPISHSLPTMDVSDATPETMAGHTVYRKGKRLADARGRPIVRNHKDADAHCKETGFQRDK